MINRNQLVLRIQLPKNLTAKSARTALKRNLNSTPEDIVLSAVLDSVPKRRRVAA